MSKTVTVHLAITGLVQGVGYRFSTQAEARRLGLDGWVRNRRDGSVEAVARGPQQAVDALVAWSHRGPSTARVDQVKVSPWSEVVEPGFAQWPTA